MAFDHLSLAVAGLALFLWVTYKVYSSLNGPEDVPSHLPWVGLQKGVFPKLRTRISSLGGLLETLESGYAKVSLPRIAEIMTDYPSTLSPACPSSCLDSTSLWWWYRPRK